MLTDIFYVAGGYVACVLFPVPGLSRLILDTWARLGKALASKA